MASLEGMSNEISVYFWGLLVRVRVLRWGCSCLLRDGARELRAVCSVWSVGVDGDDEMGELSADKRPETRQTE